MASTNIPMDKLKDLRSKFRSKYGQTTPLIVLAASVFAGSLRRFLYKETVRQKSEIEKNKISGDFSENFEDLGQVRGLEKHTNFVMALPLGEVHPGDYQFCNHWTHGIFNIDMKEPNSINRLLKLDENFKSSISNRWPIVYHKFLVPFQVLLPKFMWTKIINFNMGASIGSTNMIGPDHKVFVGGREVMEKYAYVGLLWRHSSMTAAFFSYNGTLSATLVANRNVIPNEEMAEEIMSTFIQEIEDLVKKIYGN